VIKGEGSIVTVRGKRKLGYEIDIEIGQKVQLYEITDDEDDCVDIKGPKEWTALRK
jgi:hypothetical protein